jgi:hypothetical protein
VADVDGIDVLVPARRRDSGDMACGHFVPVERDAVVGEVIDENVDEKVTTLCASLLRDGRR